MAIALPFYQNSHSQSSLIGVADATKGAATIAGGTRVPDAIRRRRASLSSLVLLGLCVLQLSCAVEFPRPSVVQSEGVIADVDESNKALQRSGNELFALTYAAHGGARLGDLKDLNFALNGRWKFLITRIQPLVTDHLYRVVSEERLAPQRGVYAAFYRGPAGTKQVFRSREEIRVWYDGEESYDADVLATTALTADAFQLFALGPLSPMAASGLKPNASDTASPATESYRRLADVTENGRRYHRIYRQIEPGLGLSEADELVLWIDAESHLTYRVNITLEGYRTTRGAHVDVSFLKYRDLDGLLLPVEFNERVRGPVAIDAHRWWVTGLDSNRGWLDEALLTTPWMPVAEQKATLIDSQDSQKAHSWREL